MAHIVRTSLLGDTTSEADGRRRTEICVGCVWLGQVRMYFPRDISVFFRDETWWE